VKLFEVMIPVSVREPGCVGDTYRIPVLIEAETELEAARMFLADIGASPDLVSSRTLWDRHGVRHSYARSAAVREAHRGTNTCMFPGCTTVDPEPK
jgi:hypothetical protein